jgi:hypothetical protein
MTIQTILKILEIDDFYGISKEIDIAKGVYKMPTRFREAKSIAKRKYLAKKHYGK